MTGFSGEMKIMGALAATETELGCVRCGELYERPPRRKFRFMRQAMPAAFVNNAVDPVHRYLSPIGTTQARAVASDLAASKDGKKIRMIVTSLTEGALRTAEIFANHLRVPIVRNRHLAERDMGEGFREKLGERHFERLMRHDYCPPGLSPFDRFESETEHFLYECAVSPRLRTDTLFITHTIRIATIVKIIKGWPPEMMAGWRPPDNCGILVFAIGDACKQCDGLIYEAI